MGKASIGFLPSNWDSWDGNAHTGRWAGAMRDRCVAAMGRVGEARLVVPPRELTADGCVSTPEDGRKALDLYLREGIEGLAIGNMTFGMEAAVSEVLDGLPKSMPILHFCTRSGPIIGGSRSTDTWCGQFMTISAIKRRGFKYAHLLTCDPEEDVFARGYETFARAVRSLSRFRNARIAQIGTRPNLFESQCFSEEGFQRNFSQMLKTMDLAEFFHSMDSIEADDPEVSETLREIGSLYVRDGGIPDASLMAQARYEVALKRAYRDLGADCMAASCWTMLQKRYGIAACSTFARLNEQGYVTACEVDVAGASTMLLVKGATFDREKPVFIDWTDLHPTEKDTWLAWHCGNAAPSLCAAGCAARMRANERLAVWDLGCDGTLEFRMKDGPCVGARILEYDGRYTLLLVEGEAVDVGPEVRGTYAWVRVRDVGAMEAAMAEAGAIHHGVLAYDAMAADALEMAAKFLGMGCVRV